MQKPDWFALIEQWKVKGMGEYGITLPFLLGALGYKSGQLKLYDDDIRALLHEMVNNPVPGYVTEVRWCGNIDAPVLSVSKIDQATRMPLDTFFTNPRGEASLGFSQSLQSMFGLNCKGSEECLEKLVKYAASYVANGQYSRARNAATGEYEYGSFTPGDIQYITDTI